MIKLGFDGWRRNASGIESLLWAAALAVISVTLGCAAPGGGALKELSPEARRSAITERVNARWTALIKGDLDAAYLFLSPASRQVVSLAEFKTKSKGRAFREARVDGVDCEADVCKVQLSVTYDHRLMKGITTPLSESWVVDQGQAWYVWQR